MKPSELRKLTNRVQKELTAAGLQKEQMESKKITDAINHAHQRAAQVMMQVDGKAQVAASKGEDKAMVMDLTDEDADNVTQVQLSTAQLKGAAYIVFKSLSGLGFKPTVNYWHDGMGMDGGYQIWIHW